MQWIVKTIILMHNKLLKIYYIILLLLIIGILTILIYKPDIQNISLDIRKLQLLILESNHFKNINLLFLKNKFKKNLINQKNINKNNIYKYILFSKIIINNFFIQYNIKILNIILLINKYYNIYYLNYNFQLLWIINKIHFFTKNKFEFYFCEVHFYDYFNNYFKKLKQWKQNKWNNNILNILSLDNNIIYYSNTINLNIITIIKIFKYQFDFKTHQKNNLFLIFKLLKLLNNKKIKNKVMNIYMYTNNINNYIIYINNTFYYKNNHKLIYNFMRFPTIKQFRISSKFNLHRVNPITGRITPHRGVDFAMPIGTPIIAVNDGEVLFTKHSVTAGYYIVIRHSHQYITRYMHLKKILVKSGQKVKQGEHIALSGNSGFSTGPHLHFELWINQKPVNPLKVKLLIFKKNNNKKQDTI
ncbi:Murein DD-endopeptidase MepM [Serratia symbiotica]|nr:Murein DD-endopeptidase MepM [Serratia symbiotica]